MMTRPVIPDRRWRGVRHDGRGNGAWLKAHNFSLDNWMSLHPSLRLLDRLPHFERRAGRVDVADAVDRQRVDDGVDAGRQRADRAGFVRPSPPRRPWVGGPRPPVLPPERPRQKISRRAAWRSP